jgi:hypothetical protein
VVVVGDIMRAVTSGEEGRAKGGGPEQGRCRRVFFLRHLFSGGKALERPAGVAALMGLGEMVVVGDIFISRRKGQGARVGCWERAANDGGDTEAGGQERRLSFFPSQPLFSGEKTDPVRQPAAFFSVKGWSPGDKKCFVLSDMEATSSRQKGDKQSYYRRRRAKMSPAQIAAFNDHASELARERRRRNPERVRALERAKYWRQKGERPGVEVELVFQKGESEKGGERRGWE